MNSRHDPPKQVLVTRPREQAEALCDALRAAGFEPLRFPTLAIEPLYPDGAAAPPRPDLTGYDVAIFISANAVEHGLALAGPLPPTLRLAVIGRASARALRVVTGRGPDLQPEHGDDSEALLALPALSPARVRGRRMVIFRGQGGRALLADTLRERGARVDYIEAYRRRRPAPDPAPVYAAWRAGVLTAATVTSNEGLENLYALLAETRDALLATPLVVVSPRAAALARQLGWRAPVAVAADAGAPALVAALAGLS